MYRKGLSRRSSPHRKYTMVVVSFRVGFRFGVRVRFGMMLSACDKLLQKCRKLIKTPAFDIKMNSVFSAALQQFLHSAIGSFYSLICDIVLTCDNCETTGLYECSIMLFSTDINNYAM